MGTPLISIIIPVYNVERYLAKCLESVRNQTYTNIEMILVNDGSTDNSQQICEEFVNKDSRFILFTKTNGGLSDARNYGVNQASGRYVSFVDSDDFIDAEYVEYLYDLVNDNDVDMSVCQHRIIFSNGRVENQKYHGKTKIFAEEAIERILYSNEMDTSAWAKLYDKKLFSAIHFPVGKLFEDIGTTYKFILEAKVIAVGAECRYNYIYRPQSIVNGSFSLKKFDLIDMTNSMCNSVVQTFPELDKAALRRKVYSELSTLNQMNGVKKYKKEKKSLIQDIRKESFKVLRDVNAPNRDKVALLMLLLGYPIYSFIWRTYISVKKGI